MKNLLRNMPHQFRWTALTTLIVLLLLLCLFMVTGCTSDTDAPLPPYRQVLCEILTDQSGVATRMRYDDGRECPLVTKASGLTPDSTYRVAATVLESENGVSLYNASMVFSPMPVVMAADKVKMDAIDVVAIWLDCRYINLRLSVKRSNDVQHYLAFVDDGVLSNDDGTQTSCIRLFHDNNGDDDNYRQEIVISCPVYPLFSTLRSGVDSVRITVNTPDGLNIQTYCIPQPSSV